MEEWGDYTLCDSWTSMKRDGLENKERTRKWQDRNGKQGREIR